MREQPARKNMRLKNRDYSQAGCYFITMCVQDRYEMLGEIVGDGVLDVPRCKLSEMGEIVDSQIQSMNDLYDNITIEKYVIMPNHVHLIIIVAGKGGSSRTPTPTNAAIPSFISTLKRYTNKRCGFCFWQRSYHDHIIRNEEEYRKIWWYVDENPHIWQDDCYFTKGC